MFELLTLVTMAMPEHDGTNNDGPGDPDGTRRRIRAHVFIAAAFGLALALAFVLFFLIFHFIISLPAGPIGAFFGTLIPNVFMAFLYGLVLGVFMALVYNGLVAHHFNIFNVDAEDYA
jgi:hypothetical protein